MRKSVVTFPTSWHGSFREDLLEQVMYQYCNFRIIIVELNIYFQFVTWQLILQILSGIQNVLTLNSSILNKVYTLYRPFDKSNGHVYISNIKISYLWMHMKS